MQTTFIAPIKRGMLPEKLVNEAKNFMISCRFEMRARTHNDATTACGNDPYGGGFCAISRDISPPQAGKLGKSRSFCRVTYTRIAFSLKTARLWRQTSHRKLSLAVDVCAHPHTTLYIYICIYNTRIKYDLRTYIYTCIHISISRCVTRTPRYLRAYPRYDAAHITRRDIHTYRFAWQNYDAESRGDL